MKLSTLMFFSVLSIPCGVQAEKSWNYTYNEQGQILTIDGPRTDVDDIFSFVYDAAGNLIQSTNPLGQSVLFQQYSLDGLPEKIIDENGVVSALSYDAVGNIIRAEVISPDGNSLNNTVTAYSYDAFGNVIRFTWPDQSYIEFEYDATDRLIAIVNMASERQEFSLDAAGNITEESIKNASSEVVYRLTKSFDELSRLTSTVKKIGNEEVLSYDKQNNLVSATDAKNYSSGFGYDELNRLVSSEAPNTAKTLFEYDAADRLTSVTDARSLTTTYKYNALGDLETLTSPDTGTSVYTYDDAGNRVYSIDERGVVANYAYDALNRLVSIQYPLSPEENIFYEYDNTATGGWAVGRLTSVKDEFSEQLFNYDYRGNVVARTIKVGNSVYLFEYKYDLADKLEETSFPAGRVERYFYNTFGQLTDITSNNPSSPAQAVIQNIEYVPFGPVSSFKYGNSIESSYAYDLSYMLEKHASTVLARSLSYDEVGNISSFFDDLNSAIEANFEYDEVSQLVSANIADTQYGYTYDLVGNRESKEELTLNTISTLNYEISPLSNQVISKQLDGETCVDCNTPNEEINLALKKPTSQSSDYSSSSSSEKAVDGNTDGNWSIESIAHTGWEDQPWWEVDLQSVYAIGRIKIFNRFDCCRERLSNFYVLISETPFLSTNLESELTREGVYIYHHAGSVSELLNLPVSVNGRYVRIQLKDNSVGLGMAEVQVLSDSRNVARFGSATQSSVFAIRTSAEKAIDGNTDGVYYSYTMAHTGWENQPWWEVDLKSVFEISHIKIFNRTDCCSERLSNFYILVSEVPFSSSRLDTELPRDGVYSYYHAGSAGELLDFPVSVKGRYVRVQLKDDYVGLGLAEVQIFEAKNTSGTTASQFYYNENGQLTGYGDLNFTYNSQNRLVETSKHGSVPVSYAHNAFGQRIMKKSEGGGAVTHYLYGVEGQLLAEYDASNGDVKREYIYFNGQTIAIVDYSASTSMYYVHNDHLATPQVLTNQNQQIVWQVESQTPFGEFTVNEDVDGDGNAVVFNQRFPGQYFDEETGLHYNYYRTYDPSLGRYLQSDPIGLDGGINTYGYVENNPILYMDELGLSKSRRNNNRNVRQQRRNEKLRREIQSLQARLNNIQNKAQRSDDVGKGAGEILQQIQELRMRMHDYYPMKCSVRHCPWDDPLFDPRYPQEQNTCSAPKESTPKMEPERTFENGCVCMYYVPAW